MSRRSRRNGKILFWLLVIALPFWFIKMLYEEIGIIGILIIFSIIISIIVITKISKRKKEIYQSDNSAEDKGALGENIVSNKLLDISEKYGGKIINDVIIVVDGDSAQIDHIFIHNSGIYVVETKNYSGIIYGNQSQLYWTQVLAFGNEKHRIYNPALQNQSHINKLNKLVNIRLNFHSLVVFVQGNIEKISCPSVFSIDTMEAYIIENINNHLITDVELDIFYDILIEHKNNPKITLEEHIKQIKHSNSE